MPDEIPEGELSGSAEIAAARAAFLSTPPPVIEQIDEPVIDTAAEEAAALDELTAKPPAAPEGAPTGAPAPAPAPTGTDPFAAFGGEEQVRTAHAVQEALRTEQGLRTLVANGLITLGYSVEQVQAALAAQEAGTAPVVAPAADDPFAGLEDDDEVTVSQVRALVERAVQAAATQAIEASQQQTQPIAEAIQQQQAQQVRNVTDSTMIELLGPIPTDATDLAAYQLRVDAIVDRGSKFYDPNQWSNPAHIREAVVRANAELNAEDEARFQSYLAGKRRARDNQPVHTGGGAGGEGPLPEPKNLAEARQQARDTGFFG